MKAEKEATASQRVRVSLVEVFAEIPDPRIVGRSKHDLVEMLVICVCALVSAFAAHAGLVLGQEACAEKSNELTEIPALLEALMLKGVIVTIDAMGTHSNIAQAIRDKGGDYVLAVKNNPPRLAESIATFFEIGQAERWRNVTYSYTESIEKDHGRIEVRRCWAFDCLDCLADPQQWPDLSMFGVIEAERTINGKTSCERQLRSQRKDAHPVVGGRVRGRQHERALRQVGPRGKRGHLLRREPLGIEHHRERVARLRGGGREHIDHPERARVHTADATGPGRGQFPAHGTVLLTPGTSNWHLNAGSSY